MRLFVRFAKYQQHQIRRVHPRHHAVFYRLPDHVLLVLQQPKNSHRSGRETQQQYHTRQANLHRVLLMYRQIYRFYRNHYKVPIILIDFFYTI